MGIAPLTDKKELTGIDYERHRYLLMVYSERLAMASGYQYATVIPDSAWGREISRCERLSLPAKQNSPMGAVGSSSLSDE